MHARPDYMRHGEHARNDPACLGRPMDNEAANDANDIAKNTHREQRHLSLDLAFPMLAVFYHFTRPRVTIGTDIYRPPWGRSRVQVPPGPLKIEAHVPYFGVRIGKAQRVIDAESSHLRYRAPWFVLARGDIGPQARFQGGTAFAAMISCAAVITVASISVLTVAIDKANQRTSDRGSSLALDALGTDGNRSVAPSPRATHLLPVPLTMSNYDITWNLAAGYEIQGKLELSELLPATSTDVPAAWASVGGVGDIPCLGSTITAGIYDNYKLEPQRFALAVGSLSLRNSSNDFDLPSGTRLTFNADTGSPVSMGVSYSDGETECSFLPNQFVVTPQWTGSEWGPVPVVVLVDSVYSPKAPNGDASVIDDAKIRVSNFLFSEVSVLDVNGREGPVTFDSRRLRGAAGTPIPVVSVNPAVASGSQEPFTFNSPTGNIMCAMDLAKAGRDHATVECQLREADWTVPDGSNCMLKHAGVQLNADGTSTTGCSYRDLRMQNKATLAYGERYQVQNVQCAVAEGGVTCENLDTRSRFIVNKADYDLG